MSKKLEAIMRKLAGFRVMVPAELSQEPTKSEVIKTLKEMWDEKPTEKEFAKAISGLPIYGEFLHYALTHQSDAKT